ncbi:MAG TPA: tRNA uridine-5-carboxymethylaminomethyl(34) synthesis GTPase MnmE [Opitutaceae bacterium]|nr:tRNA uridine-5-carboxymethylaminomethyl(34) synthesis GTPase MnmE [Opitutaceae bacterium]
MAALLPDDTIVALATPVGTSAIALIRITGGASPALATAALGAPCRSRHAHHRTYRSLDGQELDSVVATWFAAPASYTGEHVLEISCHGNPFIVRRILDDLCARGCRLAQPGEFTQRAFLNGRMDLSQAEAVMDIIQARSDRALAVAQRQLQGALGRHLESVNRGLLDTLAHIEAYIDFPDEDLPPEDREQVRAGIAAGLEGTRRLLATRRYGEILRTGVRTVILGAPNAGKSSFLNRLVGYERALVSPEPGTTRDFIEETLHVGGHALRLIDTAGLNPQPGEIERRGIEKTYERVREADLVLWMVDLTQPTPPLPSPLASSLDTERMMVIANKRDLLSPSETTTALVKIRAELTGSLVGKATTEMPIWAISATTGEGLAEVTQAIEAMAEAFQVETGSEVIAVNARHADALERAQRSLETALQQMTGLDSSSPAPAPELVSSDLREALEALGEIAGKFDNERMLDRLFQSFCIGK